MKTRAKWTWAGAGVIAALITPAVGFVVITVWIDKWVKDLHSGPLHAYEVRRAPPFLRDAFALEKARESLAREGYDVSVWRACDDDQTKAPDGTPDTYLVRHPGRPNSGTITFVDGSERDPNPRRYVQVELKGTRIECVVITPK